jgi:hypothetical protein
LCSNEIKGAKVVTALCQGVVLVDRQDFDVQQVTQRFAFGSLTWMVLYFEERKRLLLKYTSYFIYTLFLRSVNFQLTISAVTY